MTLTPLEWSLAVVGALMIGVSKTGVSGLGLLAVMVFAQFIPAKQATGITLPLLIVGDSVAVSSYRQHANWGFVVRLFPWAALGIVAGYFAIKHIDDRQAKVLIGSIVLGLIALHLLRKRFGDGTPPKTPLVGPSIGVVAGFTTLLANASGPLMAMYFLAMRLPKMEYMGTTAVFFLLINCFKVPFMGGLGLVTESSLHLNLILAPVVLVGCWVGRRVLHSLNQKQFEAVILVLTAAAGLHLIF
jgi:uncharacterized protein